MVPHHQGVKGFGVMNSSSGDSPFGFVEPGSCFLETKKVSVEVGDFEGLIKLSCGLESKYCFKIDSSLADMEYCLLADSFAPGTKPLAHLQPL